MTHNEFVEEYYNIAKRALAFCKKARKEGLLSLEDDLDKEKINNRDIFEYGMTLAIDGYDQDYIETLLSNIIKQENDDCKRSIKNIQMRAVLMMQAGVNHRLMYHMLNSYTNLTLKEDEMKVLMEDLYE